MKIRGLGWLAVLVVRFLTAAVFLYAGIIKVTDPSSFADSVASFRVLSPVFVPLVALSLPPLECGLGLALLSDRWARSAAFSLSLLTLIFLVALVQAYLRGLEVDCGCFGGSSSAETWLLVVRNIAIFAALIFLYRNPAFPIRACSRHAVDRG